jgi:hypothetical protein
VRTHRITRLREIAKSFDTPTAITQTPVKRVRTPKTKVAKSDGDDDGDESPTKKQKTAKPKQTVKKSKPQLEVKEEDESEESTMQAEEKSSDD